MFNSGKTDNEQGFEAHQANAGSLAENVCMPNFEYTVKLARSVFAAAKLPCGDDYVAIIGCGNEKSNSEAVHTLILKNIDVLNETSRDNHLEKGLEILKNRFSDVESFFCV